MVYGDSNARERETVSERIMDNASVNVNVSMYMNDKWCVCGVPKFRVRELLSFRLSSTFRQFLKQVNACFAIVCKDEIVKGKWAELRWGSGGSSGWGGMG